MKYTIKPQQYSAANGTKIVGYSLGENRVVATHPSSGIEEVAATHASSNV